MNTYKHARALKTMQDNHPSSRYRADGGKHGPHQHWPSHI